MIWQDVLSALQQVITQKQATQWMLNTAAHLNEILQDVTTRQLVVLDVHNSNSYQQIPAHH